MGSLFSGIGSFRFSAICKPLPPNVESSIIASLNVLTHHSSLSAAIRSTVEKAGGTGSINSGSCCCFCFLCVSAD